MKRLLALLLLVVTSVHAQQQPVVRAELSAEQVSVGEPVQLRVTVLAPTWFPKPPVFPSFELPNAITRLPPDSSRPTSERVDGETWSGIVRNYEVYPLAAAVYRIDDASITITYADPGSEPIVTQVAVPQISFRGVVPAGAENLDPYIAGTQLTLSREVDGDLDALEAGDALVIRTVMEIDGLPAIFLPPLKPLPEMPGVAIYSDAPVVEEGDIGRRTETSTLVFEAGGEFLLPAIHLEWWNLDSATVEQSGLEELAITVAGPPAVVTRSVRTLADWRKAVISGVAVLLAIALVVLLARRALREWRSWKARYLESEAYAFRRLRAVAKTDGEHAFYLELQTWLDKIQPGLGPRQFAECYGEPALVEEIDKLVDAVYTGNATEFDSKAAVKLMSSARARYFARRKGRNDSAIPPLNPAPNLP